MFLEELDRVLGRVRGCAVLMVPDLVLVVVHLVIGDELGAQHVPVNLLVHRFTDVDPRIREDGTVQKGRESHNLLPALLNVGLRDQVGVLHRPVMVVLAVRMRHQREVFLVRPYDPLEEIPRLVEGPLGERFALLLMQVLLWMRKGKQKKGG